MEVDRPIALVLFVCTGNSCRSQMAEAWTRSLHAGAIGAASAGTDPKPIHRLALQAMREVGVDASGQASKHIDSVAGSDFDLVVTVCDSAIATCPSIPGAARVMHVPFADPPQLAAGAATDDEAMPAFRRVRDEVRRFVESLPRLIAFSAPLTRSHALPENQTRSCCSESCCSEPAAAASTAPEATPVASSHVQDADSVREAVREGYAKIATGGLCGPSGSGGGCCGATAFTPAQLASAIGYTSSDLAASPDAANMGLSCGNPTALASLRPGEVVLDLGAGGGFDCFVAGPKVGATGRVIGVDMTPDMLARARRNIAAYREQSGLSNVEFRLGEIEHLPVADASVDVVISNCVINLSPDKASVWREIARVLKPGGRVAVSDLALVRPLPEAVQRDVAALIGCVAGATLIEQSRDMAMDAGLTDIQLTSKPQYIDAMTNWEDPLYRSVVQNLPTGSKPSDYITSLDVSARKPSRSSCCN